MAPIHLRSEAETIAVGQRIGALIQPGDIITLRGPLGSGKTRLASGILAALGYLEEVPSPTFAIVQHYEPPMVRLPLAHTDLYRLAHTDELAALALDDYLIDGALLVEWPDLLAPAWQAQALGLTLKMGSNDDRILTVTLGAAWEARWF
jgi:tRNA threonylcarbamoyladenosine biosynthesis protein TsaE